jgi:hypothetical protein
MKSLITLIVTFFLAGASFAAEINEAEVRLFLENWLEAQNTGSYANYAAMYSSSFTGIRRSGSSTSNFDYDTWLTDRKQMFKKKILVNMNNLEIKISGSTASVKFEQTWKSGDYKDKGYKLLNLEVANGKPKITREEMLFSKVDAQRNIEVGTLPIVAMEKIKAENECDTHLRYISKFTSLREKDCKKLSNKMSTYFDNRRLERSECSAPKSWRLFTVVGGERYWLEIAYGSSLWTTEDEIITKGENRFGDFQSLEFERAEWRITKEGEVRALILPVVAQDSEIIGKNIKRYFIFKLMFNNITFCGVAKSNHEARKIADKSTKCNMPLPKRTILQLK